MALDQDASMTEHCRPARLPGDCTPQTEGETVDENDRWEGVDFHRDSPLRVYHYALHRTASRYIAEQRIAGQVLQPKRGEPLTAPPTPFVLFSLRRTWEPAQAALAEYQGEEHPETLYEMRRGVLVRFALNLEYPGLLSWQQFARRDESARRAEPLLRAKAKGFGADLLSCFVAVGSVPLSDVTKKQQWVGGKWVSLRAPKFAVSVKGWRSANDSAKSADTFTT